MIWTQTNSYRCCCFSYDGPTFSKTFVTLQTRLSDVNGLAPRAVFQLGTFNLGTFNLGTFTSGRDILSAMLNSNAQPAAMH
jgi:hypothetical protein